VLLLNVVTPLKSGRIVEDVAAVQSMLCARIALEVRVWKLSCSEVGARSAQEPVEASCEDTFSTKFRIWF
jgi:hypothetical protein